MSARKTNIPAIPSIGRSSNEIDAALKATKEIVEVGLGRRGDPLDRFVTLRDLGASGLAKVSSVGGGKITGPGTGGGDSGGGAPIGDTTGDPNFGQNDYSVPPAPTGVQVHPVGANSDNGSLMVTWNPPDFSNYAYAEVFCVPGTTQSQTSASLTVPMPNKPISASVPDADYIGQSAGTIFMASNLPYLQTTQASTSSNLNNALNPIPYFFFVRFVSTAGVVGPYSPLTGAIGKLSINPTAVLSAMIDNVKGSSIYADLTGNYLDASALANLADGGLLGYTNAWKASLDANVGDLPGGDVIDVGQPNYFKNYGTYCYWSFQTASTVDLQAGDELNITVSALNAWFPGIDGRTVKVIAPNISGGLLSSFTTESKCTDGTALPNLDGQYNPMPSFTKTASSEAGGKFERFVASVYKNVYVAVDPASAIGEAFTAVNAQIGLNTTSVAQNTTAITNLDGTASATWSVQMQEIGQGGIFAAAGFGLSLDTTENEDHTFSQTSTFIINANQFAIMGPSSHAGAIIKSISNLGNSKASVTLTTSQHGFVLNDQAVFMIAGAGPAPTVGTAYQNPLSGSDIAGLTVDIVGVNGSNVTVKRTDSGTFTTAANIDSFNNALVPAYNIPFVVDTATNTVGIRGSLIVDGLVRATTADFDTLTAGSAFIKSIQANTLNANLIIGQSIIAGASGSGLYTGDTPISNYIVELDNPVTSQYPMRYWNPALNEYAFYLDRNGNMSVGGNMSVNGNGVIATNGTNLVSMGGHGYDGGYALWVGPRSAYQQGAGRTEANAAFFVRDDAPRAGFNTDLFLGDSGLMLPALIGGTLTPGASWTGVGTTVPRAASLIQTAVSNDGITLKPTRSGGPATTLVNVTGTLATADVGSGENMKSFMLKATLTGSTSAVGYDQSFSGDVLIQETVIDDYQGETWPFSLMGVVTVPAAKYYVRINVRTITDRDFSILAGWKVVAQQINAKVGSARPGDLQQIAGDMPLWPERSPTPLPTGPSGHGSTTTTAAPSASGGNWVFTVADTAAFNAAGLPIYCSDGTNSIRGHVVSVASSTQLTVAPDSTSGTVSSIANGSTFTFSGVAGPTGGGGGGSTLPPILYATASSTQSGWEGVTLRVSIGPENVFQALSSLIASVECGSTGMVINNAYACKAKNNSQGYPIEFDGTPTRLLFGGSNGVTISGSGIAISDVASVSVPAKTPIVLAFEFPSTPALTLVNNTAYDLIHARSYFKAGADASNTSTSGYATSSGGLAGAMRVHGG